MLNLNFGTSRADPPLETDLAVDKSVTKFIGILDYDARSPQQGAKMKSETKILLI